MRPIVIIGSVALQSHNIHLRDSADVDLVGDYDDLVAFMKHAGVKGITPFDGGKKIVGKSETRIYEAEIAWKGSSSESLFNLVLRDEATLSYTLDGFTFYYASPAVCLALKMTHRFKKDSPHFLKTMKDIKALRKLGIKQDTDGLWQTRYSEVMNYNHPKLNQSKKEFFTDAVPYVFDHDTIHLAVALKHKPAYNFYKPDEAEVFCSKDMFFEQDIMIRLAGVYEEACVLALERSQIPYPETDPKRSFDMALMKVCTSITSGWFREFAWENYDKVQIMYTELTKKGFNYVSMFNRGLAKGLVKPYAG